MQSVITINLDNTRPYSYKSVHICSRALRISIGGGVGTCRCIIGIPFVSTAIPTHPIDGFDGRA